MCTVQKEKYKRALAKHIIGPKSPPSPTTVAVTHTTITQHTYAGNTTMWQGNALKMLKNQS
jgi:hypothetical protein